MQQLSMAGGEAVLALPFWSPMSDAKPPKASHPLKRLLKKASRSRVSLSSPELAKETAVPVAEDDLELQRQTSIALTVHEEHLEAGNQPSLAVEQPESPISPKEPGRRASLVGKIKGFKSKKVSPKEDDLERLEECEDDPAVSANDVPNETDSKRIEPIRVAKLVKELFLTSPPFYPTTLITSITPDVNASTDDGTPMELQGTRILTTLSDQSVMAGNSVQPSVFQLLERVQFSFRASMAYQTASSLTASASDDGKPDSSVMLYVPLIPDEDSAVELAEYHLVQVPLDETDAQVSTASWWPPWEWGRRAPEPPKKKTVRVWVPSTTKVSVQLAWWGYRMSVSFTLRMPQTHGSDRWLPEPVMKVLNDKTIEAVKRAAMIATALGWLVNNIPTAGLPIELQAVMSVAKSLVPILGYIGGFVSWYWSTVASFNKGEGVVLSATW